FPDTIVIAQGHREWLGQLLKHLQLRLSKAPRRTGHQRPQQRLFVLVLGETGTGKEVVARAIHGRSRQSQGPMIRVNCGAIPPELVDSELFGHERGSFTGAVTMRKGWFERADGGTLFLDEVGELPLAAQVRLLRILQDGTFERVGGADDAERESSAGGGDALRPA
ncbi:MAG TPA: sigma-54 factor interaction domain-containing protein, partial [Tepidisphaeraceae bacterium]|nr:sigma-54 factor interaction domain-containing protein [Tepidisphaeraceae bacterium]